MDLALVLIVILVIVIIWRGPKTLPVLGKAFGQGVREARKEIDGMKEDAAAGKADSADSADKSGDTPA